MLRANRRIFSIATPTCVQDNGFMRADEVLALVGGDLKLTKDWSGASIGSLNGASFNNASFTNLFSEDANLQAELHKAVVHLTDGVDRTPLSHGRAGAKPATSDPTPEAALWSQFMAAAPSADDWLAAHRLGQQLPLPAGFSAAMSSAAMSAGLGAAFGPAFNSLVGEPRLDQWSGLARAALAVSQAGAMATGMPLPPLPLASACLPSLPQAGAPGGAPPVSHHDSPTRSDTSSSACRKDSDAPFDGAARADGISSAIDKALRASLPLPLCGPGPQMPSACGSGRAPLGGLAGGVKQEPSTAMGRGTSTSQGAQSMPQSLLAAAPAVAPTLPVPHALPRAVDSTARRGGSGGGGGGLRHPLFGHLPPSALAFACHAAASSALPRLMGDPPKRTQGDGSSLSLPSSLALPSSLPLGPLGGCSMPMALPLPMRMAMPLSGAANASMPRRSNSACDHGADHGTEAGTARPLSGAGSGASVDGEGGEDGEGGQAGELRRRRALPEALSSLPPTALPKAVQHVKPQVNAPPPLGAKAGLHAGAKASANLVGLAHEAAVASAAASAACALSGGRSAHPSSGAHVAAAAAAASAASRLIHAEAEASCARRGSSRPSSINRRAWSTEEDATISACVDRMGMRWREIAPLLPGRSDDSVRNRWKRLREEANAQQGGETHPCASDGSSASGAGEGSKGSSGQRAGTSKNHDGCREVAPKKRAEKHAGGPADEEGDSTRVSWSQHEDQVIVRAVQELGPRWCAVAARLPSRTDQAVRNRWNRLQQRARVQARTMLNSMQRPMGPMGPMGMMGGPPGTKA